MSTLVTERDVFAVAVTVTDDALVVSLDDGRTLSTPLAWYPRLLHGTSLERANVELIAAGEGLHWPELDEDLSVEGILAGRRSAETAESLSRWLANRKRTGS